MIVISPFLPNDNYGFFITINAKYYTAELTCFPAIKTIAKDYNMYPRTVQRALNDLLDTGVIKKENRYRENGGQSSNLYTLIFDEENTKNEEIETKK